MFPIHILVYLYESIYDIRKKINKKALVGLLKVASSQLVAYFFLRKFVIFRSFIYLYKLISINVFIYL